MRYIFILFMFVFIACEDGIMSSNNLETIIENKLTGAWVHEFNQHGYDRIIYYQFDNDYNGKIYSIVKNSIWLFVFDLTWNVYTLNDSTFLDIDFFKKDQFLKNYKLKIIDLSNNYLKMEMDDMIRVFYKSKPLKPEEFPM